MDDASGDALDASGNGYDLATSGTPTYSLEGPFPSSPELTSIGFAFANDRFSRAEDALDGYVSGHTGVTFEAWVYPTALPALFAGIVLSLGSGIGAFNLQHRGGGNVLWQGDSPAWGLDTSPTTLDLNAWTHVAGTLDSAAGTAVYFNGAVIVSGGNRTPIDVSGTVLTIGATYTVSGSTWYPFTGRICQVALYSAALDATVIAAHAAFGGA